MLTALELSLAVERELSCGLYREAPCEEIGGAYRPVVNIAKSRLYDMQRYLIEAVYEAELADSRGRKV